MPGKLETLHAERSREFETVDEITNAAEAEGRDLSSAELELISRAQSRVDDHLDPQIARLEEIEVSRARHLRAMPAPAPAPVAYTEPRGDDVGEIVYRHFGEYARDELIRRFDVIAQRAGPGAKQAAEERLQRVVANTLSSDVAGLIPPQYLTTLAQLISTARPIVDTGRKVALTSGTLTYPSITQRPTVAKQTTEKTETSSQKITVAFVNVTADTYAGCGDLSWQAINWSTPSALQLWFDLMAEQYAIQTEAATGTVLGAATVMATPAVPATPTLADWVTAITAAAGVIYSASNRRPDTVYADVTTGYSIMGLVSNVAPVFLTTGQFSLSSGQGNIAGLRLVISKGLAAKTVVVGDSSSLLVAETAGSPVELRAVEPSLGGMEVGVIGAFVSKITDAGAFRKLTVT